MLSLNKEWFLSSFLYLVYFASNVYKNNLQVPFKSIYKNTVGEDSIIKLTAFNVDTLETHSLVHVGWGAVLKKKVFKSLGIGDSAPFSDSYRFGEQKSKRVLYEVVTGNNECFIVLKSNGSVIKTKELKEASRKMQKKLYLGPPNHDMSDYFNTVQVFGEGSLSACDVYAITYLKNKMDLKSMCCQILNEGIHVDCIDDDTLDERVYKNNDVVIS